MPSHYDKKKSAMHTTKAGKMATKGYRMGGKVKKKGDKVGGKI